MVTIYLWDSMDLFESRLIFIKIYFLIWVIKYLFHFFLHQNTVLSYYSKNFWGTTNSSILLWEWEWRHHFYCFYSIIQNSFSLLFLNLIVGSYFVFVCEGWIREDVTGKSNLSELQSEEMTPEGISLHFSSIPPLFHSSSFFPPWYIFWSI